MSVTTHAPPASHGAVITSLHDVVALAAESRLLRSPYGEHRHVSCEFGEGILTLRGRVSSYYLKQIAQYLVCRVSGVAEIDNQLSVEPTPSSARSGLPWSSYPAKAGN